MFHPKCGPIIGDSSGSVNVFKGIPYARSPVGALRFRPPQPLNPWRDPLQATIFAAAPMQLEVPMVGSVGVMSEDCLTLNIWAPKKPGPHPVMCWIFGGANILGSASQPIYDGTYYAENGIVFVSVNYRLGVLGCLELGGVIPELAGSSLNGLRDLTAALTWIRDNITAFGGNPDMVTIMGQSAGAKNVCALMAIPAARGLFHRAVVQSGGGHTVYGSSEDSAPVGRALLAAMDLTAEAALKLMTLPTDALMAGQGKLLQTYPKGFVFRPTADGEFLPLRPIDAMREGASADVELLIGSCLDEAITLFQRSPDLPFEDRQIANTSLGQMETMNALYARTYPELSPADRHIRVLTAEEYWLPSIAFAQAHAASGGITYMYRFDHKSVSGRLTGYAGHGSDLPYTWSPPSADPFLQFFGSVDEALRNKILAMWCAWIRDGKAGTADMPNWDRYDAVSRQTMRLDGECQMMIDPGGEERHLWDGVF